ncbi:sugar ABC transporter substrate-binding protein [Gulosibacter molinativorax]|uniref:Sugar ABC transporter substrate-binding protein n=1 Tax=Gulosibacter molinativorax TaxID=256821 RepID=A0ABT7CA15_9MICO|nr:sugar ABC transporter substrate-binding protein [Gulosibacter molinativorax]MDJ1371940.1 sugar ABC transporter substrate-binding protein [Gulosibacter molinativorax]QUY62696.1 Sugar ABC transporter substrate-binding protein [Gulosibacter molinativorax]
MKNRRYGLLAGGGVALTGLLLAGCSSGGDTGATADAGGAEASGGLTVGFIGSADNEWGTCLLNGAESGAAEAGVEILTASSGQDATQEIANVEDMISRGVDAIVLNTVSVDSLEGAIRTATDAGVPIYLTAVMTEDLDSVLGATVVDLAHVGELAADWVDEDAAGADVTAAVVAGAPGASSDFVAAGFEEALDANVSVVANQPGMFNRGKAQEAAENIIQANPDLDYVFVLNEDMAFGVQTALDAAGSDAQIVTTNGTDPGLQAVTDGTFAATVSDSAAQLGANSVINAVGLLENPDGEKVAQSPVLLVTADNVDEAPAFCE